MASFVDLSVKAIVHFELLRAGTLVVDPPRPHRVVGLLVVVKVVLILLPLCRLKLRVLASCGFPLPPSDHL